MIVIAVTSRDGDCLRHDWIQALKNVLHFSLSPFLLLTNGYWPHSLPLQAHFLQVVMENNDQQVNLWPCLSTCLLLSQSLGPGEWGAMVGQAWFIYPPSCHRLGCKIMRKGMGKQDIQCSVNTIHHRATNRTRLGLYFLDSGRDSGCF